MTNVFTGFLMSNVLQFTYLHFLLYLKSKIEMACCIKMILLEKLIIKKWSNTLYLHIVQDLIVTLGLLYIEYVSNSDDSEPSWLELRYFRLGSWPFSFSSKIRKLTFFAAQIFFPYFTCIFTLFSVYSVANNTVSL